MFLSHRRGSVPGVWGRADGTPVVGHPTSYSRHNPLPTSSALRVEQAVQSTPTSVSGTVPRPTDVVVPTHLQGRDVPTGGWGSGGTSAATATRALTTVRLRRAVTVLSPSGTGGAGGLVCPPCPIHPSRPGRTVVRRSGGKPESDGKILYPYGNRSGVWLLGCLRGALKVVRGGWDRDGSATGATRRRRSSRPTSRSLGATDTVGLSGRTARRGRSGLRRTSDSP